MSDECNESVQSMCQQNTQYYKTSKNTNTGVLLFFVYNTNNSINNIHTVYPNTPYENATFKNINTNEVYQTDIYIVCLHSNFTILFIILQCVKVTSDSKHDYNKN